MTKRAHVTVYYRTATSCSSWTACMDLPANTDEAISVVRSIFLRRRRSVRIDNISILWA